MRYSFVFVYKKLLRKPDRFILRSG